MSVSKNIFYYFIHLVLNKRQNYTVKSQNSGYFKEGRSHGPEGHFACYTLIFKV